MVVFKTPEDGERTNEDPKVVVLVPISKPVGAPTDTVPVRKEPDTV
jgi:hypothetical protein